jgi:uncharacterized damage-inducible protein DinB
VDAKEFFLKYWDKEAGATRKVLERVPENSTYRPDPKSRTAREIAWLIVREEIVLGEGMEKGQLEWAEVAAPASMKEVLATYDREHKNASKKLHALNAARWEARVPFVMGGQTFMNEPGYENAWGFLLDIIHHRGQISTYLRAMGSTVPQIYGPSADEPM